MQSYGGVINSDSDYLIYDERKGRVLHPKFLNRAQFYEMWRFHFNQLRPDFNRFQEGLVQTSMRATRHLFGYLRNANLEQIRICANANRDSFPDMHCSEVYNGHLDFMMPTPGMPVLMKMVNWRDASRTYNYMSNVLRKVSKYGLDYPYLSQSLTEEQKRYKEEQLYEMFLKELS